MTVSGQAREIAEMLTNVAIRHAHVPALVQAVRGREERRRTLQRQLQARSRTPSTLDLAVIMTDLRIRVQGWRALLDAAVPEARTLLRLLIVGRLTMEPTADGYVFSGEGTVQPLVGGQIGSTAHLEWRPNASPLEPSSVVAGSD